MNVVTSWSAMLLAEVQPNRRLLADVRRSEPNQRFDVSNVGPVSGANVVGRSLVLLHRSRDIFETTNPIKVSNTPLLLVIGR